MKITIENERTVKLIPDTDQEKESLDTLWKSLIRCETDSKVLCPIGAYVPTANDAASFVIQDQ